MDAILGFLGSKLGLLGMGAALPIAFMVAKKSLPKMAGKWLSKVLGDGMESMDKIQDPVEKELVHNIAFAVVKWAEYKIPDKGQGRARFELAAGKLTALLPFLKGRESDIATIIEGAVSAMDEELKKVEPK
jgi:hypothetical protein